MIYAKTGMTEMPTACGWCPDYHQLGKNAHCMRLGMFDGEITDSLSRLSNCPLTEIDETMPAQLAAAEARCARMGQLLDTME